MTCPGCGSIDRPCRYQAVALSVLSVKDMDGDVDDNGGGLWQNTFPAEMM
jgi:hypothetical protein